MITEAVRPIKVGETHPLGQLSSTTVFEYLGQTFQRGNKLSPDSATETLTRVHRDKNGWAATTQSEPGMEPIVTDPGRFPVHIVDVGPKRNNTT